MRSVFSTYSLVQLLKAVISNTLALLLLYFVVFSEINAGLKLLFAVVEFALLTYFAFKFNFWKQTAAILTLYTLIAGLLLPVPRLDVVNETIRNQFYHVPMWFAMIIVMGASVVYSIKYLRSGLLIHDTKAAEMANIGVIFGILGLTTGMIWAKYTWGRAWHGDPKQVTALIGVMMYFAYIVLRGAFREDIQRARISAVYNIFAFPALIVLLYILPRMVPDSLHPGVGGNPAFGKYDLDNTMRMVFYPCIVGWTLMGVWLASIRVRMKELERRLYDL